MREFEIGKYILDLNNRFIYYIDGSVSDDRYVGYAEALEACKRDRDADVQSGREAELLKENKVYLYFTAEWEDNNIRMLFHANWTHSKEVMEKIHDYDDRILFIG